MIEKKDMSDCLVGCSTEKGHRPYQEDRSCIFKTSDSLVILVCDGHGGDYVSSSICQKLPPILHRRLLRCPQVRDLPDLMHRSVADAQKLVDVKQMMHCGTTCVLVIVGRQHISTLNIGDSRAVLGLHRRYPVALTWDHKPTEPSERARIEKLGGVIDEREGRIGRLALSRAIGDLLEAPYVTCLPSVTQRKRDPGTHILIVASDGFWDVFSNADAIHTAERLFRAQGYRPDPKSVSQSLCSLAIERGSLDNVTVAVVVIP